MKTIYLLIFLVLAGMAWGGDYADTTHCSNSWGDCEPPVITSVTPCMTVCIDWAELDKTTCECKVKKGHCPHCGAKFTLEGLELYWPSGSAKYSAKVGYVYFCPNGHVFWEKD